MTRKEEMRQSFEDHFYATWPDHIKKMSDRQLTNLNEDRLKDINSSYSETMLCLKSWVLEEMAERNI